MVLASEGLRYYVENLWLVLCCLNPISVAGMTTDHEKYLRSCIKKYLITQHHFLQDQVRHRNSSRLYLSAHNPEYLEYIKKKKEALMNHETVEIVEVKPIVTKHYYNDMFVNEFNLHFGYPLLCRPPQSFSSSYSTE